MKIKKKIIIKIEVQYGSKFQEEVGNKALIGMSEAWCECIKNSHKDNEIMYFSAESENYATHTRKDP